MDRAVVAINGYYKDLRFLIEPLSLLIDPIKTFDSRFLILGSTIVVFDLVAAQYLVANSNIKTLSYRLPPSQSLKGMNKASSKPNIGEGGERVGEVGGGRSVRKRGRGRGGVLAIHTYLLQYRKTLNITFLDFHFK